MIDLVNNDDGGDDKDDDDNNDDNDPDKTQNKGHYNVTTYA